MVARQVHTLEVEGSSPSAAICNHYWLAGTPNGPTVEASCKYCPATRTFPSVFPEDGKRPPQPAKEELMSPKGLNPYERQRYYDEHKPEILKDAQELGGLGMQRKWGMAQSTWASLKKRWGIPSAKAGRKRKEIESSQGAQVGTEPTPSPETKTRPPDTKREAPDTSDEVHFLRGYREAVRDIFRVPA